MSAVFRKPVPMPESVTPAWPDFVVMPRMDDHSKMAAVTNAGRPGMPYFWCYMDVDPLWATDEDLIAIGRMALDAAYKRAHPNGCPKIGH